MPAQSTETEVIDGAVERVTFYREETGYLVARVAPAGGGEPFVAVGQLPRLAAGERVRLVGVWTSHPIHGPRFQVTDCQTEGPADLDGMRAYLGSGLIPGVGPALAGRIVERFGLETLDVIEHTPGRLGEVRGLGPERREAIARAWEKQRVVKEVMLQLAQLGVPVGLAARIFQQYGQDAGKVVRERPYDLARDVGGIGFRTADQIARALGRPPDAPDRLAAGLVHCLWEAADDGHVYLPESELLWRGRRLLGATARQMTEALRSLRQGSGGVVVEELDGGRVVYLAPYFGAEVALARRLAQLVTEPTDRLAGL
ncbi:MAG: ATP-dependent RecD-like DNA helicase, partial [Chloroflexi bacterium]|nr:ATP-dependent RecD-like DNA helicase [Chloroflexota bacterium]